MQRAPLTNFTSGSRPRGFTLIEIAVGIFVIALLLGSILVPLGTQVDQRRISDTQRALEEIKEALVGFALAKGYLPCPDKSSGAINGANDTPNDGAEDYDSTTGTCTATSSEGNIPWVTLGVANSDVWNNRFRYRVAPVFAHHLTLFTLSSTSSLEVCADTACATRLTTSGDGPPAVILSHGKNGYGAINAIASGTNTAPTSTDELANTDGNVTFVSRTLTAVGAPVGEFDDIVAWLSKNILLNRMVAAGRLP